MTGKDGRWITGITIVMLLIVSVSPASGINISRTLSTTAPLSGEDIDGLQEIAWIYLHYPSTVEDTAGRNVTDYAPVKRIVVLNTDCAEAVRILGTDDRIVGIADGIITKKEYYLPKMSEETVVGTWKEFDYGAIVSLSPDLVISHVSKVPWVEDNLEAFNIPVVALDFYKRATLTEEIERLGHLEREEVVKEFVEKQDKRPRIFLEQSKDMADLNEIGTYGHGSASDELCTLAGGERLCHKL